jgi:3-hydroxybutyryl-CoA dehydratase
VNERTLRFSADDMAQFAAGSGDTSPLHTDADYARSTQYGACIVYGGLLTIGLLGSLPDEVLPNVRSLRAAFAEPVLPGEVARALTARHPTREGTWEVQLRARGKTRARLVIDTLRETAQAATILARTGGSEPTAAEVRGRALEVGAAAVTAYRPGPQLLIVARRFRAEPLHPALLDGIGWMSYAVGKGMPGFEGICAATQVTTADDDVRTETACERAWLRIREHDERTNRRIVEGVLLDGAGNPRTVAQVECFPVARSTPPEAAAVGRQSPARSRVRDAVSEC